MLLREFLTLGAIFWNLSGTYRKSIPQVQRNAAQREAPAYVRAAAAATAAALLGAALS